MKELISITSDFIIQYQIEALHRSNNGKSQYNFADEEKKLVNTTTRIDSIEFFAYYEDDKYVRCVLFERDIVGIYEKIKSMKESAKPISIEEADKLALPF